MMNNLEKSKKMKKFKTIEEKLKEKKDKFNSNQLKIDEELEDIEKILNKLENKEDFKIEED